MADRLPLKLAAILYADVAGYSRLTGEDEDATHRTLRNYLDLISTAIESHGGQVMAMGSKKLLILVLALTAASLSLASGDTHVKWATATSGGGFQLFGKNMGDIINAIDSLLG